MGEETIFVDPSYLTCEINGSQFVFQTSSTTPNTFINVDSLYDGKETEANNIPPKNNNANQKPDDEESIPIVCLDGVVYALQNGQLQKLDLSRLQNDDNQFRGTEEEPNNPQFGAKNDHQSQIDEFTLNNEINGVQLTDELTEKSTNNFLVEDSPLNANDFVEVVAAFKCKICPFTTQDRAELLKHFQNVHANPNAMIKEEIVISDEDDDDEAKTEGVKLVYMCGECSGCFPSMENCRDHMIKDHQLMDRAGDKVDDENSQSVDSTSAKKPVKVAEKKSGGKDKRDVKVSKASETTESLSNQNIEIQERIVRCVYRGCLYKFRTGELMQKHAACHVESEHTNAFKCNYCPDMKFTKWRACSVHLWKKHKIDIDLLSCNICKVYKSFTSVKLLTHMRVHSENRDFECPDCGKRFKQSSQLRNHRVLHLDRKGADIPRWYTSKTCEVCGKTYADSKCLKNHMQAVHSKLRPYVCNVCGHSSARKAMLQMHLRQHTGDKPFNCDMCEFKTGDHNSLRRHIMRHTGVRPYKCPHCPYSAIQSNSYKNHLRAKHPLLSGLFSCEMCPFKTVKKEIFMEHIGDHEKGLIKTPAQKSDDNNVEVFPGNMAAAQLIYSCFGAFSKVGKPIEASLMSSSTSADGTSQTITIQIPSTHLEGSLPIADNAVNKISNNSLIEQEDDETMHCFLKIPHEEEENIDTGGITIPAEPEDAQPTILNVES